MPITLPLGKTGEGCLRIRAGQVAHERKRTKETKIRKRDKAQDRNSENLEERKTKLNIMRKVHVVKYYVQNITKTAKKSQESVYEKRHKQKRRWKGKKYKDGEKVERGSHAKHKWVGGGQRK